MDLYENPSTLVDTGCNVCGGNSIALVYFITIVLEDWFFRWQYKVCLVIYTREIHKICKGITESVRYKRSGRYSTEFIFYLYDLYTRRP